MFTKILKFLFLFLLVSVVTFSSSIGIVQAAGYTIGLMSDGEDSAAGNTAMVTDFNHLLLEKVSGWTLDVVSLQGDLGYSDPVSNVVDAFASSTASTSPLFLVAGNHEAESGTDVLYLRQFFPRYSTYSSPISRLTQITSNAFASTTNYAFSVGNTIRMININQYTGTSTDSDLTLGSGGGYIHETVFPWLKSELKTATEQHRIVAGHEPAYPQGRHVGDSLDAVDANRDKYINLMISYGAQSSIVGHTHRAKMEETKYEYDNSRTSVTAGGMWEMDTGAFGTKAGGGLDDDFPTIGYYHANSNNWWDYTMRLVKGEQAGAGADWTGTITTDYAITDLSRQILVNTWDGSGTGTTTDGLRDMKYYVDYSAAVGSNPDWSANNSGKWWETAFNASTAGWTSGELAAGYKTGGTAPGWMNTLIDPYGGLSTTTPQVYSIMERVTFPATSTSQYGTMTLDLDDDDGVMVWLNGTLIFNNASTSISAPTTGNSSQYFDKLQTVTTNDWAGTVTTPTFTSYDVSAYKGSLVNGANTLVIWNINSGTVVGSNDLGVAVRLSMSGAVDTVSPVVSAVASSTGATTATITWTTNESSDSQIDYGLTTSYGTTTTLDTNMTTSHTVNITGLASSTLYHFRIKTKDASANLTTTSDYTFTTTAVSTSSGTTTVALRDGLNGYSGTADTYIDQTASTTNWSASTTLAMDFLGPYSNSFIKWDVSSIPSNATITSAILAYNVNNTSANPFTVFRSLRPWVETEATWNIYSTGNAWGLAGSLSSSTDFVNTALGTMGPHASLGFASTTLNASGIAAVQGWVNGTFPNYGFYITPASSASTDGLGLSQSENATASLRPTLVITYTTAATSSSPDVTPPVISNIASSTTGTTATITWTTDEAATSTLEYDTTIFYDTQVSNGVATTTHSATLTGLTSSTLHHFRINVWDTSGNYATSTDKTFTTAVVDVTPPTISSIASSTSATAATITWTTNEASDSQVEYGPTSSYTASTTLDSTATTTHSVSITGLSAATTYHFRVLTKDPSTNLATSSDLVFTTTAGGGASVWESYIDVADSANALYRSTTTNVMNFGMTEGPSTSTIKFADGTATGITLTLTGAGSAEQTGAEDGTSAQDGTAGIRTTPIYGGTLTDAFTEFGTKVNLGGIWGNNTDGSTFTATFTGLDTNKLYTVVGLGMRGKYSVRYCKYELGGATSFTNQSSSGTVATTTITTNDSTVYQCGANYTNGYVSKWTDIDPATTTLTLKVTSIAFGANPASKPYLSALKLVEQSSTPDVTAPVISSIATSSQSSTGATIGWTTNEGATTQIEYGLTSTYTASTTLDSSYVTTHSQAISGLSAATLYHYRVISVDSSGNRATSSDQTFTTNAAVDSTAPVVSLTAPSNSITLSGSTSTAASSSDNVGVAGVTFKIGTSTIGVEDTTFPYGVTFDTSLYADGVYSIVAVARDAAGNQATSSASSVTIDNTGPVLSSISSGTPGTSTATITWTTNESATSMVEYGLTSTYTSSSTVNLTATTSHSRALTSLLSSTLYHYRVVSVDGQGNRTNGTDQTFTTATPADVTPPSVTLTGPTNGSTIAGSTTTSATASDNVGVVGVKFYIDSTLIGVEDTGSPYAVTLDTTSYSEGSHTLVAVARDTAGNIATSSSFTITVDNAGPIISSVNAGSLGTSTATITWSTNEPATSLVEYGLTATYTASSSLNGTATTSHSRALSGLTASTTYHYRVVSVDSLGNTTNGIDQTFTTTATPDITVPTVSLTAPTNASTVSGASVAVSATASDNIGVVGVKFYVDSTLIGSEDTTSPYAVTFDSTSVSSGSHTLIAVARDAAGNIATSSSVSVTVDNTGPVISSVSAGTPGYATATISWTTNEAATSMVEYGLTSTYTASSTVNLTATTSHSRALTGLSASTTYHYRVVSVDGQGNRTNGTDQTFITTTAPDITAPSVLLTAPAEGELVYGTSTISATASDDVAVAGVRFYIDGVAIAAEDTSSPFTLNFNTALYSNASHALIAVARDSSNNYATSGSVSITINNSSPVVSAVSAGTPGSTSATITWTTDKPSTSQVEYGISTTYLASSTLDLATTTNHSIALLSLRSCTFYNYRVISVDTQGNRVNGSNSTFTTDGCVGNADVSSTTVQTVSTSTGGSTSLTTNTRTLELTIPTNFASSSATFQIKQIDSSEVVASIGSASGKTVVPNLTYDLQAYSNLSTNITTFAQPITLTFSYSDNDVRGFNEASLVIYRWSGSSWDALSDCVVDTDANRITCSTSHFSTYGIFGDSSGSVSAPKSTTIAPLSGSSSGGRPMVISQTTTVGGTVTSTTTSTVGSTKYVFARNLKVGSSGADVLQLQKFLNSNGFIIARTGAGSTGKETTLYGAATKAAVKAFQEKYRTDILVPNRLKNGTGEFATATRTFLNKLVSKK
jgi:nitrogen fixation protein FixH